MNQIQFAKELGVSQGLLSWWLSGKRHPAAPGYVKLAAAAARKDYKLAMRFFEKAGIPPDVLMVVLEAKESQSLAEGGPERSCVLMPLRDLPPGELLHIDRKLVGGRRSALYFVATDSSARIAYKKGDVVLLDPSDCGHSLLSPFWDCRILVEFGPKSFRLSHGQGGLLLGKLRLESRDSLSLSYEAVLGSFDGRYGAIPVPIGAWKSRLLDEHTGELSANDMFRLQKDQEFKRKVLGEQEAALREMRLYDGVTILGKVIAAFDGSEWSSEIAKRMETPEPNEGGDGSR